MSGDLPEQPRIEPGWFSDPAGGDGMLRYWNGAQWQGDAVPVDPTAVVDRYGTVENAKTPHGLLLATPGERIGAALVDTLILLPLQLLYVWVVGDPVSSLDPTRVALIVGLGLLFEVAMVALFGGSPGKLLLGLRVIDADSGVTPPGWRRSFLRWLLDLTFLLPGAGRLIGAGIVLASAVRLFSHPMRQTLWDRLAGTMVVKRVQAEGPDRLGKADS